MYFLEVKVIDDWTAYVTYYTSAFQTICQENLHCFLPAYHLQTVRCRIQHLIHPCGRPLHVHQLTLRSLLKKRSTFFEHIFRPFMRTAPLCCRRPKGNAKWKTPRATKNFGFFKPCSNRFWRSLTPIVPTWMICVKYNKLLMFWN